MSYGRFLRVDGDGQITEADVIHLRDADGGVVEPVATCIAVDKPRRCILGFALDLTRRLLLGQIAYLLYRGAFLTAVICHNAKQAKRVAEMEIKKGRGLAVSLWQREKDSNLWGRVFPCRIQRSQVRKILENTRLSTSMV